MKQLFFKTVRSNGRSVYARGRLSRTYEVGKRYRFTKKLPAHVFTAEDVAANNSDGSINFDKVYDHRKENGGGNRVLICYGKVERRDVPCFDIYDEIWDLNVIGNQVDLKTVSTDFVVIGEVGLPDRYKGIRPYEENNPLSHILIDFNEKS